MLLRYGLGVSQSVEDAPAGRNQAALIHLEVLRALSKAPLVVLFETSALVLAQALPHLLSNPPYHLLVGKQGCWLLATQWRESDRSAIALRFGRAGLVSAALVRNSH